MWRIGLQQLWAQKRRLAGTGVAVIIGIAFLAGTLMLGDTIRAGFDEIFTSVNEEIDAVVRGDERISAEFGAQTAQIDASLVDVVRDVDGVAAAAPEVEGTAQLIDPDGEPIGGQGPPTIAVSLIDDPRLGAYEIVDGRFPSERREVAIDADTAEDNGFSVGDTVTVRTPAALEVDIVGLVDLPGGASAGGATFTVFTLSDAQRYLLGTTSRVTRVLAAADEGVSEEELTERIAPRLPQGTEVITGTAYTEELLDEIGEDFLNFFETMLLVFAAIALLVATFSIYNTFSITVAQRTRQSALLRTVGASRRQLLVSILFEAAVIGTFASAIGLVAGLGLATGLKVLLEGFGLPTASGVPAVDGDTVVASFVVGIVVTMVAGALPAVRASRVPPLAALRDVAVDHSDTSVSRTAAGASILGGGVVLILFAALGMEPILPLAGLGATATLVGMIVFGPVAAHPVASFLGAPVARLRGLVGELAQQNARRNPRRTAATASALMVGIAVVTLFTVVAASMKSTIDAEIRETLAGELVLTSGGFSGAGLSSELDDALDRLDEVDTALGVGVGAALIDDEEQTFTVTDPERLARLLDLDVVAGSMADVGSGEVAITEGHAEATGLGVSSTVQMTFVDGASEQLRVAAVFSGGPGRGGFGSYLVPPAVWDPHAVQRSDIQVIVSLAEGVELAEGREAVEAVAADFGSPTIQDRGEYAEEVAGQLDQLLGIVYVLLALAIVIALMGIANALSLSIHERIREIGLLRAVGQTKRQLRSMVRWEAVLVAVFGTAGGLGLGTFLGWGVIRAVSASEGIGSFAAPVGQLAFILIVGALVGVVASIRPARRAAGTDMLQAISTE